MPGVSCIKYNNLTLMYISVVASAQHGIARNDYHILTYATLTCSLLNNS